MPNQFLVPQFIDVEDKILGPITIRQFAIMMVAIVISAIFYKLLAFVYFIIAAVVTVGFAAILAFVKVNGRPVHFFLISFIETMKRAKIRVWNKAAYLSTVVIIKDKGPEVHEQFKPKEQISGSRLDNLSLIVNTGGLYQPDEDDLTAVFDINKDAQDVK